MWPTDAAAEDVSPEILVSTAEIDNSRCDQVYAFLQIFFDAFSDKVGNS